MSDACPECGARIEGGRAGCQVLCDQLMAQAAADARYAAFYRLAFDTYCMQHPETHCRSGKSYAAHLTGLCCGVERGGDLALYTAIPRWLNGVVNVARPEVLPDRGAMTIADVAGARDVEEHARLVRAWANDVWTAYGPQHGLAREWVGAALGETRDHGPQVGTSKVPLS